MSSIYIVDDEPDLLVSLSGVLRRNFPDVPVLSTTDSVQVSRWLENDRPRVLITDVRMPEVSGLDLLSLTSDRWGVVPTVIMTAFASPEVDEALELGTFHYLPKPFRNHELVRLVSQILEDEARADSGFAGTISVSMLADVVQLHALANSSGVLMVQTDGRRGAIHFSRGAIVHAHTDDEQGRDAFNVILGWPGGRFEFRPPVEVTRTIFVPTFELLTDAARIADEGERGAPTAVLENDDTDLDMAFDAMFGLESSPPEPPPPAAAIAVEVQSDNLQACLGQLETLEGFAGACVANRETGTLLASRHRVPLDPGEIVLACSEVMRQNEAATLSFGEEEAVQEIILSIDEHYHLLRPSRLAPDLFFYLALERERANLAMARFSLREIESNLVVHGG